MAKSEFSVEGSIAIMMKDLEMIHDLANKVRIAIPITAIVAEQYRNMIDDGLGDRDCSELVTLYRALD